MIHLNGEFPSVKKINHMHLKINNLENNLKNFSNRTEFVKKQKCFENLNEAKEQLHLIKSELVDIDLNRSNDLVIFQKKIARAWTKLNLTILVVETQKNK